MTTLTREAVLADPAPGRWRRLAGPGGVAAGVALTSAYLLQVNPNLPGHYPVCPTYALAGVYCPGCGMLRATHDLLHLDVVGAMQRNPIAPLVLGGMVALWVAWLWSRWTGARLRWTPRPSTAYVLAALVIAFTVARNIPGWTWLSPA